MNVVSIEFAFCLNHVTMEGGKDGIEEWNILEWYEGVSFGYCRKHCFVLSTRVFLPFLVGNHEEISPQNLHKYPWREFFRCMENSRPKVRGSEGNNFPCPTENNRWISEDSSSSPHKPEKLLETLSDFLGTGTVWGIIGLIFFFENHSSQDGRWRKKKMEKAERSQKKRTKNR